MHERMIEDEEEKAINEIYHNHKQTASLKTEMSETAQSIYTQKYIVKLDYIIFSVKFVFDLNDLLITVKPIELSYFFATLKNHRLLRHESSYSFVLCVWK